MLVCLLQRREATRSFCDRSRSGERRAKGVAKRNGPRRVNLRPLLGFSTTEELLALRHTGHGLFGLRPRGIGTHHLVLFGIGSGGHNHASPASKSQRDLVIGSQDRRCEGNNQGGSNQVLFHGDALLSSNHTPHFNTDFSAHRINNSFAALLITEKKSPDASWRGTDQRP